MQTILRSKQYCSLFKDNYKRFLCRRCFSNNSKIGWILRQNESYKVYEPGTAVKKLYANQIGAHIPIQDMWGEATNIHNKDVMLGVFDGNAGIACSQVLSKRIFKYLTLSLLPDEVLEEYVNSAENRFHNVEIMKSFQDKYFFLEAYRKIYENSAYSYAKHLLSSRKEFDAEDALRSSFDRLESDLSKEAMEDTSKDRRMLWVGMTGTGATVVHISGLDVTVATVGDALAVVGTKAGEARVLSPEHNFENSAEVTRVKENHLDEPHLIENNLLLGQLTSFRSFGNFRYKWSKKTVQEVLVGRFGKDALPRHYISPPYLTAKPDITHYTLTQDDRFLVLATDGIWDVFPPKKVVEILLNHKPSHWAKEKLLVPWKKVQELKGILKNEKPKDVMEVENSPATQLILEAMVTTTKKLHLPKRYIRNIRDDMTAVVVYLDTEYIASKLGVKTQEKGILSKSVFKSKTLRNMTK